MNMRSTDAAVIDGGGGGGDDNMARADDAAFSEMT